MASKTAELKVRDDTFRRNMLRLESLRDSEATAADLERATQLKATVLYALQI
jgi:hypothetical protein